MFVGGVDDVGRLLKCPNCLNRSSVLSEDPILWTMSSELMDPCGNQ